MYFPIMIDLSDKEITIIGGGRVSFRKCKNLLEFGGQVNIISPKFIDEFKELKDAYKDSLSLTYDRYDKKYILNSYLVIAATSSKNINKTIVRDSKDLNILVNSVDSREDSSFITTSIIKNDNLTISISTGGSFPYLSKRIRKDMEKDYKKYDKEYTDILERIRYLIIEKYPDEKIRVMDKILDMDIEELKKFEERLINQ